MDRIYQIACQTIDGRTTTLACYSDQLMLIVNTASRCGFTSQYQQLEKLYQQYKNKGLVVLGFPCNQFRQQEPGDDAAIQQFCATQFKVSFPLFAKVNVNGTAAHPLFQALKKKAPGLFGTQAIKWNFTKFLVSPDANQVKRYSPQTLPEIIEPDIQHFLNLLDSSAA